MRRARRAAIEQNIGLACGLELKLSLAAVDVANAARAVLHAEKRKTAVVGRIVVLADAYHVFEARLTNFVGAYFVVGEFGFAFHDDPALARLPPGKLELGIRLKLAPYIFVARRGKPQLPSALAANENRRTRGCVGSAASMVAKYHAGMPRRCLHPRVTKVPRRRVTNRVPACCELSRFIAKESSRGTAS